VEDDGESSTTLSADEIENIMDFEDLALNSVQEINSHNECNRKDTF
jgi:hypothetical protein